MKPLFKINDSFKGEVNPASTIMSVGPIELFFKQLVVNASKATQGGITINADKYKVTLMFFMRSLSSSLVVERKSSS